MMMRDSSINYELHLQQSNDLAMNMTDQGSFQSKAWVDAQLRKVQHVGRSLRRLPEGTFVLLTDLDVMPLNPYSRLIKNMPPTHDLMMMNNYQKHLIANGGFYLMRNTANMRTFVDRWIREMITVGLTPRNDDQRFLNVMLMELKKRNQTLRWKTLPHELVTAKFPSRWVGPELIAFHAIGRPTARSKLQRMDEVLARLAAIAKSDKVRRTAAVWQRPCARNAIVDSGCPAQLTQMVKQYPPAPPPAPVLSPPPLRLSVPNERNHSSAGR